MLCLEDGEAAQEVSEALCPQPVRNRKQNAAHQRDYRMLNADACRGSLPEVTSDGQSVDLGRQQEMACE